MPETVRFYRRSLPHWLVADAAFFVTIRLHGSLPRGVLREFAAERARLRDRNADDAEWHRLERAEFLRLERILDAAGTAEAWLGDARIARTVLDNMQWLERQGWIIYAAVVMATHVHLLLRNVAGRTASLLADLGQFKSYTARAANRTIGRTGAFWAREDFDHWIRNNAKLDGAVRYILQNPVKAGLVPRWREWPWTRVQEGLIAEADTSPPPRSGGGTPPAK
jgi:putative transposase